MSLVGLTVQQVAHERGRHHIHRAGPQKRLVDVVKSGLAVGVDPEDAKRRSRDRRNRRQVQLVDGAPGRLRHAAINERRSNGVPNPFQAAGNRRQLLLQRRHVRHPAIHANVVVNRNPAGRLMFREIGEFGHS